MNKNWIITTTIAVLVLACEKTPEIDDTYMLDGQFIEDSSLQHPESFLVSERITNPTAAQLNQPVIILAHGYSATTYEWQEFAQYASMNSNVLVSQVLLGGHGRDYESFKKATWEDWQKPIIEEYAKLSDMGYTNINLAGSSTGCPLIVELFASKKINSYRAPKNVFLIDPIVISSDKLLSLVKIVGPLLGYVESGLEPQDEGFWYHYRPQESLQELQKLINKTREDLEDGIAIPANTKMKVYKAIKDGAADPVSAVLLYKGIQTSSGEPIAVELMDSDKHVFTRLNGRTDATEKDYGLQQHVFDEMIDYMLNP